MQYGICLLSIVPCRKDPNSSSEMVSQLLFGEHYTIIESNENWHKIKIEFDSYECWINAKQHYPLSEKSFRIIQQNKKGFATELIQVITNLKTNTSFPICIGAALPFLNEKTLAIDDYIFQFEGQFIFSKNRKSSQEIISTAYLFINAPYLWGGKSPFGIDCSGFTQITYKLNGINLPRDAYQQVELGESLNFVEEAEAGDLAFFDNEEGKIIHVGILLNNEQIIHASGSVRIDKFDHYGIFNCDIKKYSHTLRVIKRVL